MKKSAKKLGPAPHRIFREPTPAERARWKQAVSEEQAPENRAAARRAQRSVDAGRVTLGDAVRLLREERERQGLSVATLADRCDMERSALSRLENSDRPNPTIATLCALAEALGRSISIQLRETP